MAREQDRRGQDRGSPNSPAGGVWLVDFIRALRLAILAPALLLVQALLLSGAVAQAQTVTAAPQQSAKRIVALNPVVMDRKIAAINAGAARLSSVRSRKTHGSAGTFDLILSSSATNPTTEPRAGATGRKHLLVFVFDRTVNGGIAAVTGGNATAGTPTFNGSEMSVLLTGVTNSQYVTVAVNNVTTPGDPATASASIRIGFLLGDVDGNRNVSLSDLLSVDEQLSNPVTSANFLCDVNVSGTITLADEMLIDANLSQALPVPDFTPPTVSITGPASGTNYTTAQTVTITASATDNIGVTKVEFYDGPTLKGTATLPPYTYAWAITSNDNGNHAWSAKAYDANTSAFSSPVSLLVNIPPSQNQPPVANAGPDQYAQTLTALTFNGGGSSDPDGTITSYAWTFGDGSSSSGVGVAHYYATAGVYTVTLTVTDNKGATASATAKATISNRPPVANAGPDQGATAGVAVTISGAASSDPDGSIVSYAWSFGDGLSINSGNVPSVTHSYSTAGVYNATLTVTDNSGATATDVAVITVSPASTGGPFRWSKRFGGTGGSSAASYSTAVDASGNVIVAGAFWGSVDFGGGYLTSAGASDIFVAKYSPTGVHIWSKRFGSTLDDVANGVAVDASGNVILVGAFKDTVNFGGATLTAVWGGVGAKGSDVFIAKFSPTGAHLWSQRFGSAVNDSANGVAVDPSGNVVVVGSFRGIVSFGGASFTSNRDTWDLFLAKYSPDGQHVWSEAFGGTGTDNGNSIAIDANGHISITGSFDGPSADFGGGALGAGGGSVTPFFAKYSSTGVHLWSKAAGVGIGYSVAADSGGNTIATGYVMGAVDFGGGPLTDMGSLDMFVVKYSPTGAHLWSKRVGGASSDEGFGIATDSGGNVLLAGTFQGTADFGNGTLASAGSWDAVVIKYSAAGSTLWSKRYGSTGDDVAHAAAFDSSGNAIITGTFQGTVNFGGGTLTASGWNDLFILSLGP